VFSHAILAMEEQALPGMKTLKWGEPSEALFEKRLF
jgi:hypothetical protein